MFHLLFFFYVCIAINYHVLANQLWNLKFFATSVLFTFDCIISTWSFGFFIPATMDLRLRRISIPECMYPLHFCPILILVKEPVFHFRCWMLKNETTGTIFITSLLWRGPWLGIEPGTSHTGCWHSIQAAFKSGLSLIIKRLHIQLYFIDIKYLWNNALVEYIDNWTRFYSPVIKYKILVGNWKVGNPRLCCFYFQTQHRFLHTNHSL